MRPATQTAPARIAGEAAVVLLAVLAYLWLFRAYGFDVVDEGTQLAQIDRVAHGARPYLDFETGYTPWYYLLEVSLWRLGGGELLATRTFGVVLHASTVALVFACARAWFGPLIALCLAGLDVAFLLPVSARAGAPFNTPYPGWLVAPLALVVQALVAGVVHRRLAFGSGARSGSGGRAALLASGVVAGVAFSVKPNAGALILAGAALALLPSWPARAFRARLLAWGVRSAAVAATLLLLGSAVLDPAYAAALLLPLVLAVLRAEPAATNGAARPLADTALLAAGFVAPVALWVGPLLRELGSARFAREVLLLDGGGVIDAYLLPLAPPGAAALAVCAAVVAAALLARRVRDRAQPADAARWLAPAALALGVGLAGMLGGNEPRSTAEQVCVWLGPVVLAAGLLLVPRAPASARVHALLAFAAVFSLQLFPRPDLVHVAMGGPPLLLAGGAAWWWLATPLAQQRVRRLLGMPLGWVTVGLVLVLCVGRIFPALYVRLAEPMVPLDAGPRAPLEIAARYAEEQRWLGDAVRAISERTAPGAAVFYFPDLAGLGFLSGRPSPFFYLYFVPGRPDRTGERRTVAELERFAPALAVTGKPRVPAFAGADTYFTEIDANLAAHYRPARTLGAVIVRERASQP